jgi:hypothetical protein
MKICANLPFLNDVFGYRAKRESDRISLEAMSSVADPELFGQVYSELCNGSKSGLFDERNYFFR